MKNVLLYHFKLKSNYPPTTAQPDHSRELLSDANFLELEQPSVLLFRSHVYKEWKDIQPNIGSWVHWFKDYQSSNDKSGFNETPVLLPKRIPLKNVIFDLL